MQDLTKGSIAKHILLLAAPIAAGMFFQTLYYLVDLYFVATLGEAAIAGVGAAGNINFVVMALTQVLGAGTMALISHAVGRKDRQDANLIFNQSLLLAALCAVVTLVGGYATADLYMHTLGADPATIRAGLDYLVWFLPGLALQFALIAMGSALRGTGIAKPTMIVQVASVVINAILSPILIVGWLTGRPLGVAGAGLASSISVAAGVAMMWLYFHRAEKYVGFDRRLFRPRLEAWRRILKIGLPPGGEFALLFIYIGVIYWVARHFGSAAQAGFSVGSRVMQAIFLPAMAISFATAPVAGQNFGAGLTDRVRRTFRDSAWIGSAIMLCLTLLCQWRPEIFVQVFTRDPQVVEVGSSFLRWISLNFVASGLVFTCSGMFQALGNSVPGVVSGATRLLTFVAPAVWLTGRPGFELHHLWLVSVISVALQAVFSLWLLRIEMRRRLAVLPRAASRQP
ncbi:MAG: MATE family efflux transporter [Acidobacteriota bacterium]